MTDLLHTIPHFPIKLYTHLLPSLEKHLITTTDLLTLDALEVAKRAHLPLLDVKRLASHVLTILQGRLGLQTNIAPPCQNAAEGLADYGSLRKKGKETTIAMSFISTLDPSIDAALGGGIPTKYITEITGESGAGKTQLLLTLLLSAQLPPPDGLARPSLYISTEHPLPTNRLAQLLQNHPLLSSHPSTPSLNRIFTLHTPDLESQDHILTYQLPVALARHHIGLVILDSVAANYRAERSSANMPSALATRSAQLVQLGALLRSLSREHDCAIVVANQVADRFATFSTISRASDLLSAGNVLSSSPASTATSSAPVPTKISLDHQQRFFTGWGREPSISSYNLKTPSLGLVWANQITCRIALIKGRDGGGAGIGQGADWNLRRWRRWMRVVFTPWIAGTEESDEGVEFEIWSGGVRTIKRADVPSPKAD
ncbi:P-loop containing nucleoside triphosphate hydrolase protein [Usnea florida]